MKSILTRISLLAVLAGFAHAAHAQDLEKTPITPIEYLRPMKNSVSIGVRMIGGAKVQFSGNLGATAYTVDRNWITTHGYNNGTVGKDGPDEVQNGSRPANTPATAVNYTDVPGGVEGRFYTILQDYNGNDVLDANGNRIITGDYLAYNQNYTRSWSMNSADQLLNGGSEVGMSAYSASSAGSVVEADSSATPGLEIQMGRVFQRFKRFEWGMNVGFAISEFNAKTRKSIRNNIDYITDVYKVYTTGTDFNGAPRPGVILVESGTATVMNGTTFVSGTEGPGTFTYKPVDNPNTADVDESLNDVGGVRETTTVLGQNADPSLMRAGTQEGTADGFWQSKGVYYMLRVGPMVRIPIGKRFSAYVSAGYIGAYVGGKFRYEEKINFPAGGGSASVPAFNTTTYQVVDSKYNQQFMSGFYGDVNFEWWVSTRTGFYGGLAYENLGNYEQKFDGRKASVKMDNGLGFRLGVITRF